jgi:hypothetical protein
MQSRVYAPAGRCSLLPYEGNATFFYLFTTYLRSMSHHEAFEHPEHPAGFPPCRVCSSTVDPDHKASRFGICHHCMYKILIFVFIIMISLSYIAWFGIV